MRGMLNFLAIPDRPKPTELIGLREVMKRIQRSRSTLYRWVDLGIFPKQAKKEGGTTSALWFSDEVDAFIATLRNSPSGSPTSPLGLTPDRHTNIRQNSVEIRPTLQNAQLVAEQNKSSCSKKRRPLGIESEACLLVGPFLISEQEAFLDPHSGKIFAVIGQLPILKPNTASKSFRKRRQIDEAGGGE
jgi:predicted DNA-binding transcriptional regulator AlpA